MKTNAKAGEGGGLPKGLSLFRFILFSFIMLGGIYGGASLYFNALPILGDIPPHGMGIPSAFWEPSAVWLPSWMMIHAGLFVRHTKSGYQYESQMSQAAFASLSIFLGMLLFGAIGWIFGEMMRKWWVKNRG